MIKYIKRQHLDVEKYDVCIENSIQSRIYAFSWYLDIVADNWDVLVLDDYKAVMPIPWKKKYFIKYIAQPFFCQQLGVFSKKKISQELQEKMSEIIPKKFIRTTLNFNSDNSLINGMVKKKNYVLPLNTSYEILLKSFNKGRKHAVKVANKNLLIQKKTSILELIKLKKHFYNHSGFPEKVLKELSDYIINNNKGFIIGIYKDESLLGGGLFLKSDNRVTYLFSSFNTEGRKLQAASFLINIIIKQNENSNYVLDFEGGNLPNIASFFKSFGALKEEYYQINNTFISKLFSK
jgi:hypothetical protein